MGKLRTLSSNQILQLKANTRSKLTIIFVASDMNRGDIAPAFSVLIDIERKNFEPTRGDACLNIIFSNANVSSCTAFPPLTTCTGIESNHECVVASRRGAGCKEDQRSKEAELIS